MTAGLCRVRFTHDSFVPKSFQPYNGMREIAELGFIVVRIDGMVKLMLEMFAIPYIPMDCLSMQERVRLVERLQDRWLPEGISRVVFTSGGVGPTHDDVTVEAVARALDVPVVVHDELLELLAEADCPGGIVRRAGVPGRHPHPSPGCPMGAVERHQRREDRT